MRDEFREIARGWSECDRQALSKKAGELSDWVMDKKLTDAEAQIYRAIMNRTWRATNGFPEA